MYIIDSLGRMLGEANVNSSGVSNTCLFAPAPYYKLNKGFFLGFLFNRSVGYAHLAV